MKMPVLQHVALAGILSMLVPIAGHAVDTQTIVLACTTSLQDSGLLANILPKFTAETGIQVHVVAQGTGQALATAAHGDADLVLVHDLDAEAAFMAADHGNTRTEIAWNDFIIIGPDDDPTHIAGQTDVLTAFRSIAETKSPFVSRGDKSGTDAREKRLWREAEVSPGGSWYRDIGGGMGAALNAATAMNAYTLSDRGTWLRVTGGGGDGSGHGRMRERRGNPEPAQAI
jgi:tungstate transport system substrate-binding protein